MSAELYWISKTVVVDWPLKLLDGTPASTATVAGVVSKPDGSTAAMTVAWVAADLVWRATYDPPVEGWYAARLTATGTADSAEEVQFYVKPSLVGGPPPELDPTTDVGKVRLLIADVDEDNLILTDAQVGAFLTMETNVKRASALALDTIATSEALIQKVIRTQDRGTNGAALADALHKQAESLRKQADDDVDAGDGTGFYFDVVEMSRFEEDIV